ncbi:unnamed protein product [Prunus brigantina]
MPNESLLATHLFMFTGFMRVRWCSGMRFKMAFETEDSSRITGLASFALYRFVKILESEVSRFWLFSFASCFLYDRWPPSLCDRAVRRDSLGMGCGLRVARRDGEQRVESTCILYFFLSVAVGNKKTSEERTGRRDGERRVESEGRGGERRSNKEGE